MDHERFAEGDDPLLGSRDRTFEKEEVVLDDAVVGETTQGSDLLLSHVVLGGGIFIAFAKADTVNLLIDLRSVVVTVCEAEGSCG